MDEWVKTSDDDAWPGTRQAMQLEGLLVGGSSGAVLAGALHWLKSEEGFKKYGGVHGVNVVILFADGCVGTLLWLTQSVPLTFRLPFMILGNDVGYEITCRNHGSKTSSTRTVLPL